MIPHVDLRAVIGDRNITLSYKDVTMERHISSGP